MVRRVVAEASILCVWGGGWVGLIPQSEGYSILEREFNSHDDKEEAD